MLKVGFLGGGNMAQALAGGLLRCGAAVQVHVTDRHPEKLAKLAELGALTHDALGGWVTGCDLMVLAVKPQAMKDAVAPLGGLLNPQGAILSIAAGIESAVLSEWLGGRSVIRAMPNTPAMVGCGVSGLWAPAGTAPEALAAARRVLEAGGAVVEVKNEEDIDVITAIPGSGPAYVFRFMEALEKAGLARGLDRDAAHALALGTVYGAAELARRSGEDFARLRANVTSKGGTTAKALEVLDARDIDGIVDEAVEAARRRSVEMKALFR